MGLNKNRQMREQEDSQDGPCEPGFPIIEDTEHHRVVIDGQRRIWWTNKHPGGAETHFVSIWKGDPFMWGMYETPYPKKKGKRRG